MKCAVHPDAEATGFCRNCGKALCPQCTREVRGALYCEECLAAMLAGTPVAGASAAEHHGASPGLAACLGFIPGLGAVYNGEYVKALIHVLVFAGLIVALSSNWPNDGYYVFFGIALGCFYCYMPVEAYRVARARRLGETVPLPGEIAAVNYGVDARHRPVGAVILIILGILFLLGNFNLLDADWFAKLWPIGLIVLGAWLVWNQMRRTA